MLLVWGLANRAGARKGMVNKGERKGLYICRFSRWVRR